MNIRSILRKLARGEFHYALGRFYMVRQLYGRLIGAGQALTLPKTGDSSHAAETMFSGISRDEAVRAIARDSVAFGFDLSRESVEAIRAYALEQPCQRWGHSESFYYRDIVNGRLPDGTPVALAGVVEPLGCPVIARIVKDPVLLDIVTEYLGYRPQSSDVRLFWSVVSPVSDEERRALFQTIDYHFDVHSMNFIYAHFYLTDTDATSGAHVLVKGSHRHKPLAALMGSARASDQVISAMYPPDDMLTVEGPAGTGFVEDTSCFHKALAPRTHDRLLLQIRFF